MAIPAEGGRYGLRTDCQGKTTAEGKAPADFRWSLSGWPEETLSLFHGRNEMWHDFPPNDSGENLYFHLLLQVPSLNSEDSIRISQPPRKCTLNPPLVELPGQGGWVRLVAQCDGYNQNTEGARWSLAQIQPTRSNAVVSTQHNGRTAIHYELPANETGSTYEWAIGFVPSETAKNTAVATLRQASLPPKAPLPPKPVCTLSPQAPAIPFSGGYFTVSAQCTHAPTSYVWTVNGVEQPGKTNVLGHNFLSNSTSLPVPFHIAVTASNSAGQSNPVQMTLSQAAAPPAQPVCTITPQVSIVPSTGGYFTAVANCSGSPTSYTWTINEQVQPSKTHVVGYNFLPNSLKNPLPFHIRVTAANSAGQSSPAQVSIHQAATPSMQPTCSISPQVSSIPATGGYFTATAHCSESPSSYTWTINGQMQPVKTHVVGYNFPPNAFQAPLPVHISVTASNSAGQSNPVQITLSQAAAPAAAPAAATGRPPVCTLSPQVPAIPASGGYFMVSAQCAGAPTSYVWVVNGQVQPEKGNTLTYGFPPSSSPGNLSFNILVSATNSAGTSSAQLTLHQH